MMLVAVGIVVQRIGAFERDFEPDLMRSVSVF
jgi:hypothetical protein